MTIRTERWPAGVPCWVDLMTPDVHAAQAFYGQVLGWTFQAADEEYGGYVVAEVDGGAAAGIGPLQPGASPAWTLYIASEDADKTAASITENGGTVLVPPGDVGPNGRMVIASDPTGAVFGVWQAGVMIGASAVNEPGGITWEDLRSPDPDSARTFYGAVFGHRFDAVPGAPDDYTTFTPSGQENPVGGMSGMMGAGSAPAHWLVYFGVADIAASVAAAGQAGGAVVSDGIETPWGKMAGITDPDGALFWVVETPPREPAET